MNDLARQKLVELVARFGPSLVDEPQRSEALLRDLCGELRREIFVLVAALKERVGTDLLARGGAPVEDSHAGIASAINNSVARIAGLLAIAVLPAAAGLTAVQGLDLVDGFARAMYIAAALAAVGGILAFVTIRHGALVASVPRGNPAIPCYDTGVRVAG